MSKSDISYDFPSNLFTGDVHDASDFIDLPCKIIHQKVVDSTNRRLHEWNFSQDTLLYADYQTQGKGQGNHTWECKEAMGLLMSLLYHPNKPLQADFLLKLTTVTVNDCLAALGVSADIKAPNDLLVSGKKLAGILIENTFYGERLSSSIIGIGINLYQESFENHESYARIPVSLKQLGITVSRESLILDFIERFYHNLKLPPYIIEEKYQKKLLPT